MEGREGGREESQAPLSDTECVLCSCVDTSAS